MAGWPSFETVIALLAIAISILALAFGELRARDGFRVSWTRDVLDWGRRVVEILSVMEHDIVTAGNRRTEVSVSKESAVAKLALLSSLIDESRFFFENNRKTNWGNNKPRAYQGFRPKLLDCLVECYNEYTNIIESKSVVDANQIRNCKREFVSMLQEIISPRWFISKAAANTNSIKRDA